MWIVKLALNRPYTFIVLALLILILSPVVILRTPTDIFPNIDIPVIAVAWQFTGLNPQGDGRADHHPVLASPDDDSRQHRAHRIDDGERPGDGEDLLAAERTPRYGERAGDGGVPDHPAPASRRYPAPPDHQLQRVDGADSPARPLRAVRVRAQRHRSQFPEDPARDRAGGVHPIPVRRPAAPGDGRPRPAT